MCRPRQIRSPRYAESGDRGRRPTYETTVENIQSSVIVHEWYSHIMKKNGDRFKSHRLAYKNVINYKTLWNKTTDSYKRFYLKQLLLYTILSFPDLG